MRLLTVVFIVAGTALAAFCGNDAAAHWTAEKGDVGSIVVTGTVVQQTTVAIQARGEWLVATACEGGGCAEWSVMWLGGEDRRLVAKAY